MYFAYIILFYASQYQIALVNLKTYGYKNLTEVIFIDIILKHTKSIGKRGVI